MKHVTTRDWIKPFLASPLSRSFALMVIATSTAITFVMTSIQLWVDYETNIASMNDALSQVETSYSSSLTSSLWTYDHTLVQSQLNGIANLKEIEWVAIEAEDGSSWSAGERASTYILEERVPLIYGSGEHDTTTVGQLTLLSSIDTLYWSLARKFSVILFLNMIKTLCMSVIIIYLFHRIVGRHLIDLSSYLKELSLSERSPAFRLRERQEQAVGDELEELVDAINVMRANIHSSYETVTEYRDGLETALQKERELSCLQRQFVSMVSHEFRTPLAIIDGNAQRLERRKASITEEKLGGMLAKIRTSVLRMTDLMESILSSSRLEDGKIKYEPTNCDVVDLLRDVSNAFRDLKTGHEIIDNIGDLPPTITADEKLLRQIFSNLLSNAVKYSPEGTSVRLTAHRGYQNDIVISVSDEGVGIPKHELKELFQRFFRASTSTGIPGTGIGLHLVKHLVEMHGGEIDVESRPGEGSTFLIRLPINQPPVKQDERGRTTVGAGIDADLVASATS
ncbi:MAG: ATP-binding protein [Geminicoccales bacterium]